MRPLGGLGLSSQDRSLILSSFSFIVIQSQACFAMTDHTTDIEKAPDDKKASVEVPEGSGPHRYAPRTKGFIGKARFLLSCNLLCL